MSFILFVLIRSAALAVFIALTLMCASLFTDVLRVWVHNRVRYRAYWLDGARVAT